MERLNLGEDNQQILKDFRRVARSYVALFKAQRDHVFHLLGGTQRYSSGIFREGLLRTFLSSILPQSVSVDSGFIYGFEQEQNSKQIDILVWDSARYAPVYRTKEFVIVQPEAVIVAISVKTQLDSRSLAHALDNLLSIAPLEITYRSRTDRATGEPVFAPIEKIIVSYDVPLDVDLVLDGTSRFFRDTFSSNVRLAREMLEAFTQFNPINPAREHTDRVERVLPSLMVGLEGNISIAHGWGPPEHQVGSHVYGPGLRRLPYMYPQQNELTTSLEKLVFHVLQAVYAALGTPGWSLVSAWGEFNPATGIRIGDAAEQILNRGVALLDPDRLATEATEHVCEAERDHD